MTLSQRSMFKEEKKCKGRGDFFTAEGGACLRRGNGGAQDSKGLVQGIYEFFLF